MSDKLLTAEEVASMLGVSLRWVYQHSNGSRRPKIPCIRIGEEDSRRPSYRLRRASIEEFIRAMEQVA